MKPVTSGDFYSLTLGETGRSGCCCCETPSCTGYELSGPGKLQLIATQGRVGREHIEGGTYETTPVAAQLLDHALSLRDRDRFGGPSCARTVHDID